MWLLLLLTAAIVRCGSITSGSRPDSLRRATGREVQSVDSVHVIVEIAGAPLGRTPAGKRFDARHTRLRRWIETHGGRVFCDYRHAYNGLWAELPARHVDALRRCDDVQSLHSVSRGRTSLEGCVRFIGAHALDDSIGYASLSLAQEAPEPVRIGIIDTGIDYTHLSFGGSDLFPNLKVVGGYDFAGDTFSPDPNDPRTWAPRPDADPMDQNGHGTFVAGLAAGQNVPGKLSAGVAPNAVLYAYKVTGPNGEFVTPLLVQAIERAIVDRVDVLNLSLGTNFGPPSDPAVAACNNAVAAGILVVAAAGNFGDAPYGVSSPAIAPGVIAVAASIDAGPGTIRVASPSSAAGRIRTVEGTLSPPLRSTGPRSGDLAYVGLACPGNELLPSAAEKIALIDRGVCSFREKLLAAQSAGAVAAVVVNNVPGTPFVMEGDPAGIAIPALMVSQEDGEHLKALLANGETVVVDLSANQEADRIWGETSRGPALTSVALKPDIAAPGFRLVSALAGSSDAGFAGTGTSASAPLVTGVVALLRHLRPDWSVEEIKALVMNTAAQTTIESDRAAPLVLQGAGRIRADVAARTHSVALGDPGTGSLSFGFQSVETPGVLTRTIRLRNKSGETRWYTADADLAGPLTVGMTATVLPPGPILLRPGEEASVQLMLTLNPAELIWASPDGGRDGFVTIKETSGTGETLRVPFHIVPRATSHTRAVLAGQGNARTVVFASTSVLSSRAELFALGDQDPEDAGHEVDIRYTGCRAVGRTYDDLRLEFAVATYHPWTTPDFVTFRVRVDVNEDGQYDATLYNVGSDVYVERLAVSPLAARSTYAGTIDSHSGVMCIMAKAKDLGLTKSDTRFAYWVESTYGSASPRGSSPPLPMLPLWGASDQTDRAKFDGLRPMFRFNAGPGVFRGASVVAVQVDSGQRSRTPSAGLLALYPQDSALARQAEVLWIQ
jgi:hypothetical protein